MAREKQLLYFTEENRDNPFKDDVMVNLTVSGILSMLLKEFLQSRERTVSWGDKSSYQRFDVAGCAEEQGKTS